MPNSPPARTAWLYLGTGITLFCRPKPPVATACIYLRCRGACSSRADRLACWQGSVCPPYDAPGRHAVANHPRAPLVQHLNTRRSDRSLLVSLLGSLLQSRAARVPPTRCSSPKWVPQLADAADVLARVRQQPGTRYTVLTPNMKARGQAELAGVQAHCACAAPAPLPPPRMTCLMPTIMYQRPDGDPSPRPMPASPRCCAGL